jgi:Bacterial tandem repeat domain 1
MIGTEHKVSRKLFLIIMILLGWLTTECTNKKPLYSKESGVLQHVKTPKKIDAMKFSRKPPVGWMWSHDIEPDQVNDIAVVKYHLVRLCSYSSGKDRRFAAISFSETGISEASYLIDMLASELDQKIDGTATSITCDEINNELRFSVLFQKEQGPQASIRVDLDQAGLIGLNTNQNRIVDFTTYIRGGLRRYAAIVEERPGPSIVFARLTAQELDTQLHKSHLTPVRIRGFFEGGTQYFTAVVEDMDVGDWAWYYDLTADEVASKLEKHNAYPVDLQAYRGEHGVRYTVVMYRDHKR